MLTQMTRNGTENMLTKSMMMMMMIRVFLSIQILLFSFTNNQWVTVYICLCIRNYRKNKITRAYQRQSYCRSRVYTFLYALRQYTTTYVSKHYYSKLLICYNYIDDFLLFYFIYIYVCGVYLSNECIGGELGVCVMCEL